MGEIVFVTHNKGKAKAAEKYFKNLQFTIYQYELEEPRSDDIRLIAEYKVREAYNMVKKPCVAMDADFYIDELNGFPKAFVNFALETIGVEGILKLMEGKNNRNCSFRQCLAYYDGKNIKYFYGENKGTLALKQRGINQKEKWSDLWYVFIPQGFSKTLAEMTKKERDTKSIIDKSTSALEEFAKWYKNDKESDANT